MNNQRPAEFMVLGVKGHPVADTETEKDNPYIFNSLERALQAAKEISKEHDGYGIGSVVRLDYLEEFYGEKVKKTYEDQELQDAYEWGLDYAKNGANETNCHFSIFSSPEKKKAWERGAK